jgi:hypothetical protein
MAEVHRLNAARNRRIVESSILANTLIQESQSRGSIASLSGASTLLVARPPPFPIAPVTNSTPLNQNEVTTMSAIVSLAEIAPAQSSFVYV